MQTRTLAGGFSAPASQAARAFREIMEAMARPGTLRETGGATPPHPLSPAAGTVLLTLCDPDTPIYLAAEYDRQDIRAWITFHTGAPIVAARECLFAVGPWEALLPLSAYCVGTADYPDMSATLIVECNALSTDGATLRGPGIKDTASLSLPDIGALQANHSLFPLGLDFIFTSGTRIAALPRSTEVF